MQLSRNTTLLIQFLLDECLPPIIRDSRWFMWLPLKLLFGEKSEIFLRVKDQAHSLTKQEFRNLYEDTANVHFKRETDLNRDCIDRVLELAIGPRVLDIACGRGFLTGLLASRGLDSYGADIVIADETRVQHSNVTFQVTDIEALPFRDRAFDTVICAHTLEHVQNLELALAELRRTTSQRLIVVVPKQRNYRYTFDLHLHFFTYPHDLLKVMGKSGRYQSCENVGGDLVYVEDLSD